MASFSHKSRKTTRPNFPPFGKAVAVDCGSITLKEKFRISLVNYHESKTKGETYYTYTLAVYSRSCVVSQKRFRDFYELHRTLQALDLDVLPRFPSRFFRTKPQQRLEALRTYLDTLRVILSRGKSHKLLVAKRTFLSFAGMEVKPRISVIEFENRENSEPRLSAVPERECADCA